MNKVIKKKTVPSRGAVDSRRSGTKRVFADAHIYCRRFFFLFSSRVLSKTINFSRAQAPRAR